MNNFLLIFSLSIRLTLCVWVVVYINPLPPPPHIHFLFTSFFHAPFREFNIKQKIRAIVWQSSDSHTQTQTQTQTHKLHMENHLILTSNECLICYMSTTFYPVKQFTTISDLHKSTHLFSHCKALCFRTRSYTIYTMKEREREQKQTKTKTKTKKTQRPSDAALSEMGMEWVIIFVLWCLYGYIKK